MLAAQKLKRLEVGACIDAYATTFVTDRGSLILVTNNSTQLAAPVPHDNEASSLLPLDFACRPQPYDWICGMANATPCDAETACLTESIDKADWRPFGSKVEYCLSEPVAEECSLHFSPRLAWVVIVFNLAKAILIAYVAFRIKENPLLTVGDAVSSFLERADETTESICLMEKDNSHQWKKAMSLSLKLAPMPYKGRRARLSTVVSWKRWATCMTL
jgi:hypothetical protein